MEGRSPQEALPSAVSERSIAALQVLKRRSFGSALHSRRQRQSRRLEARLRGRSAEGVVAAGAAATSVADTESRSVATAA